MIRYVIQSRSINDGAGGILPPGVDAEHPEKYEHVESAALNALQLHEKPVLQNAVDAPPPRDT